MVKENQHLTMGNRSLKTLGRKTQYGRNLLPCHIEPFHNFLDGGSGHKILKNRSDRHTCATENPGAAHLPRHAFDCGTLRPIENHIEPSLSLMVTRFQRHIQEPREHLASHSHSALWICARCSRSE